MKQKRSSAPSVVGHGVFDCILPLWPYFSVHIAYTVYSKTRVKQSSESESTIGSAA